jgi:hypothetical protein
LRRRFLIPVALCMLAGCSRGHANTSHWSHDLLDIEVNGGHADALISSAGTNDGGPRVSPNIALRHWKLTAEPVDAIRAVLAHFAAAGSIVTHVDCSLGTSVSGSVEVDDSHTITGFTVSMRGDKMTVFLEQAVPASEATVPASPPVPLVDARCPAEVQRLAQ